MQTSDSLKMNTSKIIALLSIITVSLACKTTVKNCNKNCNFRNMDFTQVPPKAAINSVRQSAQKITQYVLSNSIDSETEAVVFSPIDTVLSMSQLMNNSVTKDTFWTNMLPQPVERSVLTVFSLKPIFRGINIVGEEYFSRMASISSPVSVNLDKDYFILSNETNENDKTATLKSNIHIHLNSLPLNVEQNDK